MEEAARMGLCQCRAVHQMEFLPFEQAFDALVMIHHSQCIIFQFHVRALNIGLRHMTLGCPAATCPFRGYHLAGLAGWRDAQVHSSCYGKVAVLNGAYSHLPRSLFYFGHTTRSIALTSATDKVSYSLIQ